MLGALARWRPTSGTWVVTGVDLRAGWGESTIVTVSVETEHRTLDKLDRRGQDELKATVRDALPGERLIVEVLPPS